MDFGLAGPPGERVVPRVATARGLKFGHALARPLPKKANHVREVIRISEFAICVNVQVFNKV